MNVRIYQINLERDIDRIAFESLDRLERYQGSGEINSSIYDKVYEGEVEADNLEDVFRVFNLEHPEDYRGRSLSVSDIVEVVESQSVKAGFYFCDSVGFKEVEFDPEEAGKLHDDKDKIRVVLLEPGKVARITEINHTLEDMQGIVHGDIEAFYPFEEEVCIVCNEEGKLNGMALNRAIYAEPAEKEMTYGEMASQFRDAERSGKHLEGYIVFTEDSFKEPYPEAARTYCISSNNKAFQPNMGGYSIYGSALDGSDPMVRLEQYMAAEKGGENGWKIERCYMKEDTREMIDIIAGTCFICDCSGDSFGSLTEEQAERYAKQFQLPERFVRINDNIHAVPFKPMEDLER